MNPFLESTVAAPVSLPPRFMPSRRLRQGLLALGLSAGLQAAVALDINTATAEALQTLKGMGQKTAAVIVAERRRGGAFLSFDDIVDRVNGVGAKRLSAWQQAGLTITPAPMLAPGTEAPVVPGRVLVHTNMPAQGRGKAAR
ncbi:MAG: DUF655 domain-containing protein [Pigmentiphaga sp.]|nr:DUF655 domain-containing protein [Pigmentiphaga sp.]